MELDPGEYVPQYVSPSPIELRPADSGDLPELVGIRTSSFGDTEQDARDEIELWLRDSGQEIHLAQLEGCAIGMVRISTVETAMFINSFAVRPEYQGRGLGRAVLQRVIDRLLARKQDRIILEVEPDNVIALSLYRACGFQEGSTYDYYRMEA